GDYANYPRRAFTILIGTCIPAGLYGALLGYGAESPWLYAFLLLTLLVVITWHRLRFPETLTWKIYIVGFTSVLFVFSSYWLYRGEPGIGFYAVHMMVNLTSGILFLRQHRRWTPGVIATSFGFIAWALTVPALFFSDFIPIANLNKGDLWNIPKFIVFIGMI